MDTRDKVFGMDRSTFRDFLAMWVCVGTQMKMTLLTEDRYTGVRCGISRWRLYSTNP